MKFRQCNTTSLFKCRVILISIKLLYTYSTETMANRTIHIENEELRRRKSNKKRSMESMAHTMNEMTLSNMPCYVLKKDGSQVRPHSLIIIAMDKGNKGEERVRMAEAVLGHPEPVIVGLGVFQWFDAGLGRARRGSRCSSESLKVGANPAVAHGVELEEVGDMPDMALGLCALACWYRHSEWCAALDDGPAVDSVVKALSC